MTRFAAPFLALALVLAGCGGPPPVATVAADDGIQAAGAAKATLAKAFEKALADMYGDLYTPSGAKVKVTGVETYKIQGGSTRVRGTIVVDAKAFTAELEAMAGLTKGEKVNADYFPRLKRVSVEERADFDAAAIYATGIQRMDTQQLHQKSDLGKVIDPRKYAIKVLHLDKSYDDLAEVSFQTEGFMGKGSTFTEYYRVVGKRTGAGTVITEIRYNDNKATDPNGNDLDQ